MTHASSVSAFHSHAAPAPVRCPAARRRARRSGSRPLLATALIALPLLTPGEASAQLISGVDLGSRGARLSGDVWQSQLAVTPFTRFEWPNLSIDGRWTALGQDGGHLTGDGRLSATAFSPSRAGFRLSLEALAERTILDNALPVTRYGADVQLSYRHGRSGVWLGREVTGDDQATPLSPVPRVSFGGWRQIGNAVFTLSVGSYSSRAAGRQRPVQFVEVGGDSVVTDTGVVWFRPPRVDTIGGGWTDGSTHAWNDAQFVMYWTRGRLALAGTLGARVLARQQPNEAWASAQGAFALTRDLALIVGTGVRPSSVAYGVSRARFLDVGVRVAPRSLLRPRLPTAVRPVAAAFELREEARGRRTIRIRVPQARTVELSGDFTGWKPVALAAAGDDRWETTLVIPSGVHRLAIRVDGEGWVAPPGISTVADEFQGTVGVIVVP